jgi:hypothetical protein
MMGADQQGFQTGPRWSDSMNRNRLWAAMTALTLIPLAGPVVHGQGHVDDVGLTVLAPGGPITTSGGDWSGTYAGRVFEGIFAANTASSPGFDAASGTFPLGSQIRFDFAKQLLYWNGTALATPTASMTLDFQAGQFATITGGDMAGAPGFIIDSVTAGGGFHDHLDYTVSAGAPAGLYGLVLTLGPGGGSTGFTSSAPFLVTLMQGNLDPTSYTAGMNALVDAAFVPVPEPSTLALAVLAAAAGIPLARLRRLKK